MKFKLLVFLFYSVFNLIAVDSICEENVDPADDENNIERPCPDFDVDCIRNYFSNNSRCDIARGPVPDPLFLSNYRLEIANSNLTAELNSVKIEGLNGNIIEFYVNHGTEKLVLATRMQSIKMRTPKLVVQYNRKAKEPIVRSDSAEYDYGPVTLTAVFTSIFDLDLYNTDIFSYIENSHPKFSIGRSISDTSDPTARKEIEKFYASGVDNLLEGFITQGRIFMINYIQYNICDFGL